MPPVVSIITVSYNAETEIEQTIRSVLNQTYLDYEYVFVDGASNDGTVAIIESYRQQFEAKGISYRVTSEKDRGIYDAMNKGVHQACGKWILMLNAGDCLADSQVMADVFSSGDFDGEIVYGDVILKQVCGRKSYYKYMEPKPLEAIQNALPFCHQSVFVPRDLMCRYGFDTSFRIAADYNFFSQAYTAGAVFAYVPRAISVYDLTGVSSANPEKLLKEYAIIHAAFYPKVKQPEPPRVSGFMCAVKKCIKWLLPDMVYSPTRGWSTDISKVLQKSK